MRKIASEQEKIRINSFLDWIIYMIGYALVFLVVSLMFKSFQIDMDFYGLYALVAVVIMYFLNKTVKPILVTLTIPITGVTLGLFYPFINLFILKLTDWILGSHFTLENIWIALVIAILISIMNVVMEGFIIKPILKRMRNHG